VKAKHYNMNFRKVLRQNVLSCLLWALILSGAGAALLEVFVRIEGIFRNPLNSDAKPEFARRWDKTSGLGRRIRLLDIYQGPRCLGVYFAWSDFKFTDSTTLQHANGNIPLDYGPASASKLYEMLPAFGHPRFPVRYRMDDYLEIYYAITPPYIASIIPPGQSIPLFAPQSSVNVVHREVGITVDLKFLAGCSLILLTPPVGILTLRRRARLRGFSLEPKTD
jgi:hypothetical protein